MIDLAYEYGNDTGEVAWLYTANRLPGKGAGRIFVGPQKISHEHGLMRYAFPLRCLAI